MRLINVHTLQLETFNDERNLPAYAILSHRWIDGEEVLFKDLLKNRNDHLRGWWKIRLCCSQAVREGIGYAWVDTCCIDKSSSAELSEAINSMFRWYSEAQICYAYLADVIVHNNPAWQNDFVSSAWFTRSWTLQELLAPRSVQFYDRVWDAIGLRPELAEEIAEASGIHLSVFNSTHVDLTEWSIAQRMSWASKRTATRVEDTAYSLLGIFDVNMPLLYGEGKKAFKRLQEEIIRSTFDHTIFAWSTQESHSNGLLAASPGAFVDDFNVTAKDFYGAPAYTLTNLGLALYLPTKQLLPRIYCAGINATQNGHDPLAIWLVKDAHRVDCFSKLQIRGRDGTSLPVAPWLTRQNVEIDLSDVTLQSVIISTTKETTSIPTMGLELNGGAYATLMIKSLKVIPTPYYDLSTSYENLDKKYDQLRVSLNRDMCKRSSYPFLQWNPLTETLPSQGGGTLCTIDFPSTNKYLSFMKLGFDTDFKPFAILAETINQVAYERETLQRVIDKRAFSGKDLCNQDFWQSEMNDKQKWLFPTENMQNISRDGSKGLWFLKVKDDDVSIFSFRLDTNPDWIVTITFELLQPKRLIYGFSLAEFEDKKR